MEDSTLKKFVKKEVNDFHRKIMLERRKEEIEKELSDLNEFFNPPFQMNNLDIHKAQEQTRDIVCTDPKVEVKSPYNGKAFEVRPCEARYLSKKGWEVPENLKENTIKEDRDFGVVNIRIDGDGFMKNEIVNGIRKTLGRYSGERHLFVDGEEVSPY